MQLAARDGNVQIDITPTAMYNFFLDRVWSHLHVVLCMSPIGDAFRTRLRRFPSLINCCTIDWFHAWPEDALEMVANQFLEDTEMQHGLRKSVVTMCQHFHKSSRELSDR